MDLLLRIASNDVVLGLVRAQWSKHAGKWLGLGAGWMLYVHVRVYVFAR
jgi:hypothetical protein